MVDIAKNIVDQAKQFATDALKTSSKRKKEENSRSNYWVNWIGNTITDVVPATIDLIKRFPKKIKNIYGNRITDEISIEIYIYIPPEKNIKISMKLD